MKFTYPYRPFPQHSRRARQTREERLGLAVAVVFLLLYAGSCFALVLPGYGQELPASVAAHGQAHGLDLTQPAPGFECVEDYSGIDLKPQPSPSPLPVPVVASPAPVLALDDDTTATDTDTTTTATTATTDKTGGTLRTVLVVIDTDTEFLSLKFGDSIPGAQRYIAGLISAVNVTLERDLSLRLIQGTTLYRTSDQGDPYTVHGNTSANSAKLNELINRWTVDCAADNLCNVQRGIVLMLSGKSPSTNGAQSGIATPDSLCNGYVFYQANRNPSANEHQDSFHVAHEIGHVLGSPHTQCYNPPIDRCVNFETGPGCYTGQTQCPAPATYQGVPNVTGTLMSYCYLSSCGASMVMHPRTVELLLPKLAPGAAGSRCLGSTTNNSLFIDSFESGSTAYWQPSNV